MSTNVYYETDPAGQPQPVQTVEPEIYGDENRDTARKDIEIVSRLLMLLTDGAARTGPLHIARKILILSAACNRNPYASQAALANALGLSKGRISQLIKSARRNLRSALD